MSEVPEIWGAPVNHLVAENTRLANELTEAEAHVEWQMAGKRMAEHRAANAEAAVARVRELCETQGLRGRHIATHTEVLRALDGGTE